MICPNMACRANSHTCIRTCSSPQLQELKYKCRRAVNHDSAQNCPEYPTWHSIGASRNFHCYYAGPVAEERTIAQCDTAAVQHVPNPLEQTDRRGVDHYRSSHLLRPA